MSDDARIAALEAEVKALREAMEKLEAERWDRIYDRLAELERRPVVVPSYPVPVPYVPPHAPLYPALPPMYPGGPLPVYSICREGEGGVA